MSTCSLCHNHKLMYKKDRPIWSCIIHVLPKNVITNLKIACRVFIQFYFQYNYVKMNSSNSHSKVTHLYIYIIDIFLTSTVKLHKLQSVVNHTHITLNQGLLYHRTCKPDFLCSWPSLNSYLK